MILTVTLNPCIDHVVFVPEILLGDANRVSRVERDAGGKGVNLSRVVDELGGATTATGFLGGAPGAFVKQVLDEQGVTHRFVNVSEPTRMNISVETELRHQPPTQFNERGPNITAEEWTALVETCREVGAKAAWAVLAGSLPPGVPVEAYQILCDTLKGAGCRVALDADGEALKYGLKAKPDFIKPNQPESARLLGRPVDSLEQASEAAQGLTAQIAEGGFVVVSRGADGAVMASPEGVFQGISPEIQVKSTIGSGDSMIAGILWALETGKSYADALRWGLASGAATASTDGTEIARRGTITALAERAEVRKL